MSILLKPETLTAEAFAPFGDVIQTAGNDFFPINYGKTERYHDLALLDTLDSGGKPTVSIFRSEPATFPLRIALVERHPLGSQAFIAMARQPFVVVVAPAGEPPAPTALRAFLVGENQGVNYRRGVWHHYMFSLAGVADFLCLDRSGGDGNNCDEHRFDEEILLSL